MAEARLFQALSDATRLRIIGLLAGGPVNVTGIVNRVQAAQPAVSRHLRILKEVGLIRGTRLGKEVEYSLEADRVSEACAWLGSLATSGKATRAGDGAEARGSDADSGSSLSEGVGAGRDGGRGTSKHRIPEKRPARTAPKEEKRIRRISPLQARRGIGPAGAPVEGESPHEVGGRRLSQQESATGAAPVSEGRRRPASQSAKRTKNARARLSGRQGTKAKQRKGRVKGAEIRKTARTGPETGPAYEVERNDDTMDDFLL
jgi:DNA-binding transcriptional ArsR family regulator